MAENTTEKTFIKRRRVSRPLLLIVVCGILLISPLANYVALSLAMQIPWTMPRVFFKVVDKIALLLMFLPVPLGIGLLMVKRWAWWLLLAYGALLIAYNLFSLLKAPGAFNAFSLTQSVVGFALLVYFLRRDVSAPYFKMYPRGWRYQKRRPIETDVLVNGRSMKTTDLSVAGFFVQWPDCPYKINDVVSIQIQLGADSIGCAGGVVRTDERGAGLAFRNLNEDQKMLLDRFVN